MLTRRDRIFLSACTLAVAGVLAAPHLCAQRPAPAAVASPAGLVLRAATNPTTPEMLLEPDARVWQGVPTQRVALNRTPPLYDTDPPAELEIEYVDVRLARAGGKLLLHLTWKDPTQNAEGIAALPSTQPETRDRKEHTAATERFFDAAAVMFPERAAQNGVWPSLQMGDAAGPVLIYYWNAARGAMLMQAEGRGTTRRTGETFPARALYRAGAWQMTMELPDLRAGLPLSLAVWNGAQQDRDGRKYFSVWLRLE